MNKVFIRTAGVRDLKAVRDLLVETWHDTYDPTHGVGRVDEITAEWHSIDALRKNLDRPGSEFVLADDGTTIAGMAYAVSADAGRAIMLHQLYVRPDSQGHGIGGLLLDEIEGSFHEARKMRLEVEEANTKAVAFYLARGFARAGHTANCGAAGSGIPALIFERSIFRAKEA